MKFNKLMADVETLIEGVAEIFDQNVIAKKRLAEMKANPSIGKPEKELDDSLKNRRAKVDWVEITRVNNCYR